MSEKGKRLEKEQMMDVITRTALGLEAKLLLLQDSYNIYHKNYSPEALELYSGFSNYSDAVHRMMASGQLGRLPPELLKKFMEYSLVVSDKLHLGVRTPDGQKRFAESIEYFKVDLYNLAKNRLEVNRVDLKTYRSTLLGEIGNVKGKNLGPVYRYYELCDQNRALTEKYGAEDMMYSERHHNAFLAQLGPIEEEKRRLLRTNPIISQISQTADQKRLRKDIEKLCDKIWNAQEKVLRKLENQTYPIWELTPLIDEILGSDGYRNNMKLQADILDWISIQERTDKLVDAFKNAIPMALSVMCFFVPGGVGVSLLVLQAMNTVAGVAAAIDDIVDAVEARDMAYSHFNITDEQKKLVKDCNVSEVDRNLLMVVISSLFVIADVKACMRIMRELCYYDNIAKVLLRFSGKNGAKLLKILSKEEVQKLAHACEKINPKLFNRVADLPENEIKRLVKYPDIDAVLKKIDKLPKRSEIKADDIFEELIALRKKSEDIIKEAGYSHLDVVTSQKNNEMVKKLQESIPDDKLIENIREGRDAGNKSLEKILNELDKSKVMRGVRITRDNLKDFIPDVSSHKSSQIINAIRNRSDSQDVIDYMQELFDKYGRVEQVMQEHHWIKQEYITNGGYPFLKYDLLKDERNLSTIIGHVGCHKKTYNKFLEKELKNIKDYWKISSGDIDGTNDLVLNLIEDLSNKVKRDNNFMNNKKLYILN